MRDIRFLYMFLILICRHLSRNSLFVAWVFFTLTTLGTTAHGNKRPEIVLKNTGETVRLRILSQARSAQSSQVLSLSSCPLPHRTANLSEQEGTNLLRGTRWLPWG